MTYRFFVVDDDRHYARLLSYRLDKDKQHEVRVFHSGEDALDALDERPDLILLDIMMPGIGGLETLQRLRKRDPDLPVVMISAQGTVEVAVQAMKGGALDYITKGQDDLVKLDVVVKNVKEKVALQREVESLRGEVAEKYGLDEIVGDSPAMEDLYRTIRKTLRGNLTVAIQGESGTGKELVARAIHFNSDRGAGPFVVVNCAAIPSELMESEFFGHEKGSFTGAHARKIGKFEEADGGTIFLDEIGELDLGLQAKLLRALQNREITRVGGSGLIKFDARVISATNKDILGMIRQGTFREDLYYRLFQFPVVLPPLRDRQQDVLVLAHHFLTSYKEEYPQFKDKLFSSEATRAIAGYNWPGNVRELKNVVERAVLIADNELIQPSDLMLDTNAALVPWNERVHAAPAPKAAREPDAGGDSSSRFVAPPVPKVPVAEAHAEAQPASAGDGIDAPEPILAAATTPDEIVPLEDLKRRAVEQAYHACEGNVDRAAVELGIGRATMYRLLKKYEINT
ncbi:MAG: sigma-54 dependent transcriptional regulator, partial [Bacteroidota bacterium]